MAKLIGETGIGFARAAMAMACGRAAGIAADEYAKAAWPSSPSVAAALYQKTVVASGGSAWGGDTVWNDLAADFLAAVRPLTVMDRAPFRRVPLKVAFPRETSAATTGSWASGGQPIAV